MAGYLFGGNTGISYTDLQRRREMADALSKQLMGDTPKTTAQGIGALMKGIGAGIGRYSANKGLKDGTEKANSAYDSIFSSLMGGAPVGSPSGMPSAAASAGGMPMPGAASEVAATSPRGGFDPTIKSGIEQTASALGINPVDLATAISYETGGTFDPKKGGPTTQWGQHRGLIQFGEPQAKKYGVNWDDPVGSQLGENGAVAAYLRDTGVKPGMGLMDIYSAINAGGVGRYNRSDANNGGAPGTVADKVNKQMAGHRAKALAMFGTPNEVASLDASIGVPYQPSMEPQDPNAEARRQEAMKQIVGNQPNAAGAVNAMGQGSVQPLAYVDPMVSVNPPARASNGSDYNSPMMTYDDRGARVERPSDQRAASAPMAQPQQVAQAGQPQQPMPQAQQPQNPFGGVDPKLLQLMSNPFLDPDKKAIIQNVIQQQMQAGETARQEQQWRARQDYQTQQQRADPSYQLEMETKQAQLEALRAKPQKQWQKLDDGTLFNPETAETKRVGGNPDGTAQFRFGGSSVEAQALNGLMQSGALTEAQAQQLGAGKTISGPNGQIIFMTPQGVFGRAQDGSVAPMPGGAAPAPQAPQSVDIFAGTPETNSATALPPVLPQPVQPQAAPQTEQRPGMIPLTQGQGLDDKGRERRQMAIENGLDPNSDEGKRFILTGTLPASDRGVTAGDREAIRDADDQAQASRSAIEQLQSVIAPRGENGPSLNDSAGSGALADWQAWAARNDPTGFFDDKKGEATTELSNTVLGQALGSLKSIFGAAPTEGERQILLDMQASVDKTPAERKIIIDKAISLANRKLQYQRDRAADLRGGDYYKSNRGQPNVQTNTPSTPAEAMGLPSIDGPAPNKRLRFNPATGDFE